MTNEADGPSTERPRRRRKPLGRAGCLLVLVVALVSLRLLMIQLTLWRAAVCIESRAHESALTWLGVSNLLDSDNAETHYLQARAWRRLREFDKVEVYLKRAYELGWDARDLKYEQLLALAQTGQYDEIGNRWSELFSRAGSDGPEICNAYVTKSFFHFRIDNAVRVLDGWASDYPRDPQPHFLRGQLGEVLQSWADAENAYREALRLGPDRPETRFRLAVSLMKLGKFKEAEGLVRQVLKSEPSHLEARMSLAQCLIKLDQENEARQILDRELRADPKNFDALREMGNLELSVGRHEEALKFLRPAAARFPENAVVRYALARALRKTGETAEADEHYKFVDLATKALLKVNRLTERLIAEPQNVELRYDVAMITWRYNSRDEGAKWLRSVLEFDPHHKPTHTALAKHFEMNGDAQRAVHHRRLAAESAENTNVEPKPPGAARGSIDETVPQK